MNKALNDQEVEAAISRYNLKAPRVTPLQIEATIKSVQYYVFPVSQLTICCVTLQNGFTVTGESACASPENYNEEIGRGIAYKNAKDKVWMLEGYLLKQRLHEGAL